MITKHFKTSDWIALAALAIGLFNFGWQILDVAIGAQTELISLSNRTIEFRCSSKTKAVCWGDQKNNIKPQGRLSVILPAVFDNTGVIGKNDVISNIEVKVQGIANDENITLVANQFSQLIQGRSSQEASPFVPFVVEKGNATAAELRFVAFSSENFILWDEMATRLASNEFPEIVLTMSAFIVGEKDPLQRKCKVILTERLKKIINERRSNRSKQARLTTTCK